MDSSTLGGDADGIHDEWEVTQLGSTEAANPGYDNGGEGSKNLDEFIAGTLKFLLTSTKSAYAWINKSGSTAIQ